MEDIPAVLSMLITDAEDDSNAATVSSSTLPTAMNSTESPTNSTESWAHLSSESLSEDEFEFPPLETFVPFPVRVSRELSAVAPEASAARGASAEDDVDDPTSDDDDEAAKYGSSQAPRTPRAGRAGRKHRSRKKNAIWGFFYQGPFSEQESISDLSLLVHRLEFCLDLTRDSLTLTASSSKAVS